MKEDMVDGFDIYDGFVFGNLFSVGHVYGKG
jgi:hypothetical protein